MNNNYIDERTCSTSRKDHEKSFEQFLGNKKFRCLISSSVLNKLKAAQSKMRNSTWFEKFNMIIQKFVNLLI